MKLFGGIFGGEQVSNRETSKNEWKDFPAFQGEQKNDSIKPQDPEEKQAQINNARDAVKNAYNQNSSEVKPSEMSFEMVEQKTKEFFDAMQDLTDGMNLYYGTRCSWPQNSREFVDKFGGDKFKPQNSGDSYAKISFATTLIDAEIRRRNASESTMVSVDEKRKIFSSFQYPLYKVYIPPEMGGSAWKGFDEHKFQISNPEFGLGGAYEKFFGSSNDPERKALVERAIESYSALMPFMDAKTGRRAISEFLTKNRGRQIEGFREKEQSINAVEKDISLFDLRDDRDGKISDPEDEIESIGSAQDTYTRERIDRLKSKIQKINDEKVIIERLIGEYPGLEKIENSNIREKLSKYIDEQEHLFEVATAKRDQSEKGSEEFRNYARARDGVSRRIKAAKRMLDAF